MGTLRRRSVLEGAVRSRLGKHRKYEDVPPEFVDGAEPELLADDNDKDAAAYQSGSDDEDTTDDNGSTTDDDGSTDNEGATDDDDDMGSEAA